MKFTRYINESIQPEHRSTPNILADIHKKEVCKGFIETIKKDCTIFLEDTKDCKSWLVRWTSKPIMGLQKFVPRADRKPTDTPQWLHDYMDKLFYKKFGWKARSEGVFAITVKGTVQNFELHNPIFPIGKYKYIWSPDVTDLYMTLENKAVDFGIDWRIIKKFPVENKRFKQELDKLVLSYKDNDIEEYFDYSGRGSLGREIMIQCQSYYLLEPSLAEDVLPRLYE